MFENYYKERIAQWTWKATPVSVQLFSSVVIFPHPGEAVLPIWVWEYFFLMANSGSPHLLIAFFSDFKVWQSWGKKILGWRAVLEVGVVVPTSRTEGDVAPMSRTPWSRDHDLDAFQQTSIYDSNSVLWSRDSYWWLLQLTSETQNQWGNQQEVTSHGRMILCLNDTQWFI